MINKRKAFTLVELIVVMVVISILATISFMSYKGYSVSARDSVIKSDFSNIEKAMDIYYAKNGFYPEADEVNGKTVLGNTGISKLLLSGDFINKKTEEFYSYIVSEDGQTYKVFTNLEETGEEYSITSNNRRLAKNNDSSLTEESGNQNGGENSSSGENQVGGQNQNGGGETPSGVEVEQNEEPTDPRCFEYLVQNRIVLLSYKTNYIDSGVNHNCPSNVVIPKKINNTKVIMNKRFLNMNFSVKSLNILGNTESGIQSFSELYNLTSLKIGDNSSLGKQSFKSLGKLENIVIGDNVTISTQSFSSLTNLKTLKIGNNFNVGLQSFQDLSKLEELRFGDNTNISSQTFSSMRKVRKITIGNNFSSSNYSFTNLNSLELLTIGQNSNIVTVGSFTGIPETARLKITNLSECNQKKSSRGYLGFPPSRIICGN